VEAKTNVASPAQRQIWRMIDVFILIVASLFLYFVEAQPRPLYARYYAAAWGIPHGLFSMAKV